ncbi:DUF6788 family protein [Petrachloros mirabilis]
MDTIQDLEAKRDALLAEMKSIRSMRRGTINEQFLQVPHVALRQPVKRGPYFVFSRYDAAKKKTISQRLTTAAEVEQARTDVAAYKRYVALCDQFEALTERLGELEHRTGSTTGEKKRRKSRSNRTPK